MNESFDDYISNEIAEATNNIWKIKTFHKNI